MPKNGKADRSRAICSGFAHLFCPRCKIISVIQNTADSGLNQALRPGWMHDRQTTRGLLQSRTENGSNPRCSPCRIEALNIIALPCSQRLSIVFKSAFISYSFQLKLVRWWKSPPLEQSNLFASVIFIFATISLDARLKPYLHDECKNNIKCTVKQGKSKNCSSSSPPCRDACYV